MFLCCLLHICNNTLLSHHLPLVATHCVFPFSPFPFPVETTLEHCVQRLRKRMTAESEAAQLAALKHQYQQHGEAGANPGMFKKDRLGCVCVLINCIYILHWSFMHYTPWFLCWMFVLNSQFFHLRDLTWTDLSSSFLFCRTPSFYTSKSLVNLSGLSISDPAPIQQVRSTVSISL